MNAWALRRRAAFGRLPTRSGSSHWVLRASAPVRPQRSSKASDRSPRILRPTMPARRPIEATSHEPTAPEGLTMLHLAQQIAEAVGWIRNHWESTPRVGIILGTGLGSFTEEIAREAVLNYHEIPHFPR